MLIDAVTRNPGAATTKALVRTLKDFGRKAKHFRRRFIACLPEIQKRKCWPYFGFKTITKMASTIADFSPDVVTRVLSIERRVRPYPAVKRLFEQTNIGWSKFELAARVIDEETCDSLLKLLKEDAAYSVIKTYVLDIERKREVGKATKEQEEAEPSEPNKVTETSCSKTSEPSPKLTAAANGSDSGAETGPLNNIFHTTSEKIIAGAASKKLPEQSSLFSTNTDDTSGKQPAIGKLVMQGGVQTVTLTLYPRVAERLMQKVDKLGQDMSRVKGVSKVISHLLDNCGEDLVLDENANFFEIKKEKVKHTTEVVFWDKGRDSYSTRTRFGTVLVNKDELKKSGADYENPIRMDDLYIKAKEKAAEYNAKVKRGEQVSRKLPAAVEKFLFYDSGGGFCQYPGCNKRAAASHHGIPWAVKPNCCPDSTYKPCDEHHELNHLGVKGYGDSYGDEKMKQARKSVNRKYRRFRRQAKNRKKTAQRK